MDNYYIFANNLLEIILNERKTVLSSLKTILSILIKQNAETKLFQENQNMKTYISKVKHIIPIYLVVSLLTVVGLLLFRWLFAIQFEIIDIKEEFWHFWFPLALPWIPILIWLKPRFKALNFKGDTDRADRFYTFISGLALVVCLIVSQEYLTTSTAKMEQLQYPGEITAKPKARFYKINRYKIEKKYISYFTNISTSGRYNQYLDFSIYFVFPVDAENVKSDTVVYSTDCKLWFGTIFKKEISNRISNEEKEVIFNEFFKECSDAAHKYNQQNINYFERLPTSKDRSSFLEAIHRVAEDQDDDQLIILRSASEPYSQINGHKLAWIFGSFGIGLSILLFSLIFTGYSSEERKRFLSGKKSKENELTDILKYLIPQGDHFATSLIIDLNLLVFILMLFAGVDIISPNGKELFKWGANLRPATAGGEWWRLFTSMFVHSGIIHLFSNISGLVLAGIFIEPIFGRKKYFIIYIISGLFGSLASIIWHEASISVGASGAIFGLYGSILGLLITNAILKTGKKYILSMIGLFVGINLLWGLTGGIDNAAHIGGLVSGAITGLIIYNIQVVLEKLS